MQPIPAQFQWLLKIGQLPCMIAESLTHNGLLEHKGPDNNPSIMKWAHEIGGTVERDYVSDEVAWCGLYVAILAQRCGYQLPQNPLWALNWANFGRPVKRPYLGCVLTFHRYNKQGKLIGGHVAPYIAESSDSYLVHGGNQDDSVCFAFMKKTRLYMAVEPEYKIGKADHWTQYYVTREGKLSDNEQ